MQNVSQETVTEAANGSEEAFEDIYRKTSTFVYNVALRMVSNKEDAEEITQEVFVKIFRKLSSYRFESSLKTWIYRITVNSALNYIKKNKKQEEGKVSYDDTLYKNQVQQTTEPQKTQYEQKEILEPLLRLLNPDQRACIVLRSIEGLSYQEIAESLKININTVRSRLKRARETLLNRRREVIVS